MTTQQDEQTDKTERGKKLRQAYTNATTQLREAHREEFDNLYAKAAEALGVDYTPRPSAEQKAEEQISTLLDEYPHLRERLLAVANPSEPKVSGPTAI